MSKIWIILSTILLAESKYAVNDNISGVETNLQEFPNVRRNIKGYDYKIQSRLLEDIVSTSSDFQILKNRLISRGEYNNLTTLQEILQKSNRNLQTFTKHLHRKGLQNDATIRRIYNSLNKIKSRIKDVHLQQRCFYYLMDLGMIPIRSIFSALDSLMTNNPFFPNVPAPTPPVVIPNVIPGNIPNIPAGVTPGGVPNIPVEATPANIPDVPAGATPGNNLIAPPKGSGEVVVQVNGTIQ